MAYTVTRSAKGIVDQINDLWADPIFQGNDWQGADGKLGAEA